MNDKEYAIAKLTKMINAAKSLRNELVKTFGTADPIAGVMHALYHDLIDVQCSVEKISSDKEQPPSERDGK